MLLHDHLDGGLRPQTVLELADEAGYRDLPADDAESLAAWFRQAADSGSLVRYLETFAHTVGVMQRPEAIHRVARECALDLAADGVVYAEVRFAPELSTAQGLAIEDVVEAMVDGFEVGSREAAGAGTPIRVGALLCAMRQADRWEEVAGLVVRYRDHGVVGFDLAGPEIGFPPDRIPSAIGMLVGAGAHRTIHAGEADGIESIRAALDGAHAERLGHGVRIADEVGRRRHPRPAGRSGCCDEQVVLEVAPSSNVQTGAYPSLAEHPIDRLHRLGLRRHRQHRQPADERGVGEQRAHRRRHHVRLVLGRRPERHRAGPDRRVRGRCRAEAAARPRWSARRTPRSRGDHGHPAGGNRKAIFAANLGVPAQRPVILPDGLSGHERIRADPAFHPWAQTIASEDAGAQPRILPFHGPRSELYRSPTPHDCGPPCLVRVERGRHHP